MNELEKTQVPENGIVRMAYEMFVPSVVQEILARKSIHEGVAAVSDPEKVLSFLQVVNYVAAVAALFSGQGGGDVGTNCWRSSDEVWRDGMAKSKREYSAATGN